MKIGVFGGSFNPPHKMHLQIAIDLLDKGYVDKVIYVPTGSKYKYKSNLVADKYRYEMLKIMTKNYDNILVNDFELKKRVVYTYETLAYFKDTYPNDEVYFICGADNFSYIDEWMNGLNLLETYKILVIRRDGQDTYQLLEKYKQFKDNIIVTDVIPRQVSSAFIRNYLFDNDYDKVIDYLCEGVINYIKDNKLYISSYKEDK